MKNFFTQTAICFFIFFLSIVAVLPPAAGQTFNWVTGGGTTVDFTSEGYGDWEKVEFMCTDPNGNVYAISQVGNTTITADTFSGIAHGNYGNILITSYTCSGQMRWAKLISSSGGNCVPYALVSDNLGHIYVAGYMNTATLYIGSDTSISGIVYEDEALIQLDTTGHFNWIRFVGNNTLATFDGSVTYGSSAAVDAANNIHFFNSMKYGVPITSTLTSHYGTYDLMYNASGTLLSVKQLQIDSTLNVVSVIIDKQNNKAYAIGCRIEYDWTFYGGDSSAYNFVAAFDTARNRIWIDTIGDPPEVDEGLVSGIAADGAGHLYLCGTGDGFLVYEGDTIVPPTGAYGELISYVMKMDTAGNKEWIKQCNGNSSGGYEGLVLMPNNKIAATGNFYELVTGKTITGAIDTINAGVGEDPFFTVMDTAGNLITLQAIHGGGGAGYNGGTTIASDGVGNLYIGGYVADTIPDTLITSYHSVGGNTDFFVLKYGVDCSCTSMPVASYTSTGTSTVSVTYTGTTAGIDSVVWNFGDGSTDTGMAVIHAYTVVGTIDLCVTVYTGCGYDIYCNNITVNCTSTPVSSFTDTGSAVLGFTYTGTTIGLDSVSWNYGDGHTGTGTTPLHTYSASGTYTVCATVYTGCGSNTACNTIVVNCTPVSSFTDTGTYIIGFTYTGTTTGIDSVVWDFGDGGTSATTDPIYTYTAVGTYTVCVTAYSACGSNTYCNTVVIPCVGEPTASFTDTGTLTVGFTYTGTTTAITGMSWSFGDGGTSTTTNPIYTYTAAGTYNVCVTVYSPCGSNTYCSNVVIPCVTPPIASFSDTGTTTIGFAYTGTTAGIDSIVWSYGDGSTDTGMITFHTYAASDTYQVCVTVYTPCGIDSSCSEVIAIGLGVPGLSLANVQMYPNPTTDELYITGIVQNTSYRLLTVTSECIQQGTLKYGSNTLSMKTVAPGIYILEMTGADGERDMVRVVKE